MTKVTKASSPFSENNTMPLFTDIKREKLMKYFKSFLLLIVLIYVQLYSTVSYAKTNTISISSGEVVTNVVLPGSLCDISDRHEGQALFDLLTKIKAKAKARDNSTLIPDPLRIIGKCGAYENLIYPWGYIAFLPNDKSTNTQKKYNNLAEEVFGSQQAELGEMLNDIIKDVDMSSMIKEDYGLNLDQFEIGKFKVIKATDSAVHVLAISSFEFNGIKVNEVITMSQQVMGDQVLTIYVYHLLDDIIEALSKLDSIDEALKTTKIIN